MSDFLHPVCPTLPCFQHLQCGHEKGQSFRLGLAVVLTMGSQGRDPRGMKFWMQGCRPLAITAATADSLGTPLLFQKVQGGLAPTQGPIPGGKVPLDWLLPSRPRWSLLLCRNSEIGLKVPGTPNMGLKEELVTSAPYKIASPSSDHSTEREQRYTYACTSWMVF